MKKQLSDESKKAIRDALSVTRERCSEFHAWCELFESDFVFYYMSEEDMEAYDETKGDGDFDWSFCDDLTGGQSKHSYKGCLDDLAGTEVT